MAAKKTIFPCIHCNPHDYKANSSLASKIITEGAYKFPNIFNNTPKSKIIFTEDYNLLLKLTSDSRGNQLMKPLRNAQSVVVHNNLAELLAFIKPICGSNIDLIIKSGFDVNVQPQKAPIPDQPVILRIVKGALANTYKIFIQRRVNKPDVKKAPITHQQNNTFGIEITLTPEILNSWVNIKSGIKSNKLLISKYTPFVRNYIRIYSQNASGESQRSAEYSFFPE